MTDLIAVITASDPALRNQSLDALCSTLSLDDLLRQSKALDAFRRASENLYERVRALFFLYAIHRFHLPARLLHGSGGSESTKRSKRSRIPFSGYDLLLRRRFEEYLDAREPDEAAA